MTDWHTIDVGGVERLREAIVSSVEHRSAYGSASPDWQEVLDDVEASEDGLDLGSDTDAPAVKAILRIARSEYRQMRDEALS